MIAIDVESTGLDPHRDSILSIGALDMDEPANQFYGECRIWDGAHVEDAALAVNGFTREEISDPSRMTEAELVRAFIAWAEDRPKDRTLLGQNVSFDRDFVAAAAKRARVESPFPHRSIDTHTLAWMHMTVRGVLIPEKNGHDAISLDYALRYCGLPSEPAPHNARNGAYAHAEVAARLAYTRKLLPDFMQYDIPWQNT
ncbi:MAG: 3'-5' exonuclease [Patescibacteria group bacterium]|nr:3'-5' exonuclease [Patescibacteria group bacterium]